MFFNGGFKTLKKGYKSEILIIVIFKNVTIFTISTGHYEPYLFSYLNVCSKLITALKIIFHFGQV